MQIFGLMLILGLALQGTDTQKVETAFDKKADFASFRTYSWGPGYNAFNPDAHKIIVAALEAEMAKLGFTKVATGANVTLAYYTLASTNVDLKALDKAERAGSDAVPTKTLGRLVVIMRSPASGGGESQQVWSASTREYIDADLAKLDATVRTVAARLFATYPRPR